MKAIVVTRQINDLLPEDKFILDITKIFKIAVNYANVNNPNYRLFHDYGHYRWYFNNFNENNFIVPEIAKKLTDKFKCTERVHLFYKPVKESNTNNDNELYFQMGSIVPSIDFCIKQGATQILLIANNKVHHEEFKKQIRRAVDNLKQHCNIYQHSQGNFNLPVVSIKDFIEKDYEI